MSQIGFKPSGNARGVGDMLDGQARVTFLGAFEQATWITEVGVRTGRNTATNGIVVPVFYDQASANSAPTTLAYSPTPKTVSTPMNLTVPDPSSGVNVPWAGITGVLIAAGRTLGGGIWADPAGGSVGYGQSNSGKRLYRDTSAPTVPDPFGNDANSPEGDIDVWMIGTTNRQPNPPTIIGPAANGVTSDPTPDITIGFSDPDIPLGDVFSAYQVEVWNSAKTSRLRDSTKLVTNGTQQTERKATYTVVGALAAADYYVRAYTWDAAGIKSGVREWRITVNAGGAYEMQPGDVAGSVGTHPTGLSVLNDDTPSLTATWQHQSAADADTTEVRIQRVALSSISDGSAAGDTLEAVAWALASLFPYRGPFVSGTNVADDGTFTFSFTDPDPDWTALEAGDFAYRFVLGGTDALGSPAATAVSERFIVNGAPAVSTLSPADEATVATRPILSATVSDPGDGAGSHTVEVDISTTGAFAGEESTYALTHIADGVYQLQTTATHLPALDDYFWRAIATDAYGLADTSVTHDLHYVAPPDITVTNPVDDSTITTGTPTVTATVDRTITHQRVTIRAQGGSTVYFESGEIGASGSAVSVPVDPAKLKNETDYDLEIWIRAADGLEGTSTTQFRLEYIPDPAMTNVSVTAVAASIFDTGAHPQQPNVEARWDVVSTGTVSDEDWLGYIVEWEAAGHDPVTWRVLDRNQPGMTDTRVPGGVLGTYTIQYERLINAGFDVIRSAPVTFDLTVDVKFVTITSEHPDDPAITSRYGRDRTVHIASEKVYQEILGQEYDDEWSSPRVVQTVDIELHFYDDATGAWTALDAVAALEQLAKPVIRTNDDGRRYQEPRVLTYRDPRNRNFRLSIEDIEARDPSLLDRAVVRLHGRRVSEGV